MDEKQLRLECLKVARDIGIADLSIIDVAHFLFCYVQNGVVPQHVGSESSGVVSSVGAAAGAAGTE